MDLYTLLGVEPAASSDEIKRAYRKLAIELHPDRNADEKVVERFKEITAAYRTLSNAAKRRRYDDERRRAANPVRKWEGPPRKERGNDLRYRLEVPFEVGVAGGQRTIEVPRQRTCDVCRGAGAERVAPGNVPPPCRDCDGAGRVVAGARTRPCERCSGRGLEPLEACRACGGSGRTEKRETVQVEIPAGSGSGRRLRLEKYGDDGTGGADAGDLFVLLSVADHQLLRLDGFDLELDLPVPWAQAMLGTEMPVPTLDGVQSVKIPPGTLDGAVIRLEGKGAPTSGKKDGPRGDQLLYVEVVVPEELDDAERAALQSFAAARPPQREPRVKEYLAVIAKLAKPH